MHLPSNRVQFLHMHVYMYKYPVSPACISCMQRLCICACNCMHLLHASAYAVVTHGGLGLKCASHILWLCRSHGQGRGGHMRRGVSQPTSWCVCHVCDVSAYRHGQHRMYNSFLHGCIRHMQPSMPTSKSKAQFTHDSLTHQIQAKPSYSVH